MFVMIIYLLDNNGKNIRVNVTEVKIVTVATALLKLLTLTETNLIKQICIVK